jgi:poly-gamma-glutamate biosynthesis protein PgsC/CapC
LNRELIIVAIGIALGMIYFQRTGLSPGGIITPGILALHMSSFQSFAWTVAFSIVIFILLEISVRIFGVYGRQRTALSLLMAAAIGLLPLGFLPLEPIWLGWVIPGLVASDIQRQGFVATLSGLVAISGITFMAGGFLF